MPSIDSKPVFKDYPIIMLVEKTNDQKTMRHIIEMTEQIKEAVCETAKNTCEANVKFAIYTFSDTSTFFHPNELKLISEFELNSAFNEQIVDLSPVLLQLNNDLSRKTLLNNPIGYMLPMIILVLAGDKKYVYGNSIDKVRENMWFKRSRKAVFLMNENDTTSEIGINFTGTSEAVIKVYDIENAVDYFKELICFSSIMGSMLAPRSLSSGDDIVSVDPIEDNFDWDDEWDEW